MADNDQQNQQDPQADETAPDGDRAQQSQQQQQPAGPTPVGAAGVFAPIGVDPTLPERRDGRLTRKGMEDVIRRGGSVLHKGVALTRLDHLPSEAELSQGDTQAEADALKALDERQAALDRERAMITQRRAQAQQQQQQQQKGKGQPTPPAKK